MGKEKVKVMVLGGHATGKSSIMWSFAKLLQDYGFDVDLTKGEHKTVKHLQMAMEHDITLQERMNILKDKVKIELEEVNTVK